MMHWNEIQALRKELRSISKQVKDFDAKLDQLETTLRSESKKAPTVNEAPKIVTAPKSAPITPPPLPKSAQVKTPPPATRPPVIPPPSTPAPKATHRVPQKTSPSLGEHLWSLLKRMGPKEEMGWEMALGAFWLPRIGILVLAIGVVWLATLAMQRFGSSAWLPHLRVGFGYAVALTLLGLGKRIEKRYHEYARILLGGGITLSYFMTFATHYIPYTRIIPRPEITLILLSFIVLLWTLMAQFRQSPQLGFLVTAMGHATVALSTLTLATPSRFAVIGLVLLSVCSAFFMARNGWRITGFAGLVGSYGNHFFWLAKSPGSDLPLDFIVAMSILVLYWFIFASAEYFASGMQGDKKSSLRLRTCFTGLNTGAFLILALALMRAFPFSVERTWMLYGAYAAVVLLLFGLAYWKRKTDDPLYNAYFVKSSALIALGLAAYFDGTALAISLAVEAIALLFSARWSKLLSPRLCSLGAFILAFLTALYYVHLQGLHWSFETSLPGGATDWRSLYTPVVLYLWIALYIRMQWRKEVPTRPSVAPVFLKNLVWQLGLLGEDTDPKRPQFMKGRLISNATAAMATMLMSLVTMAFFPVLHQAPLLSLLALFLVLVALLLRIKPFTESALIVHAIATLLAIHYYLSIDWEIYPLLYVGAVALPMLLMVEITRWIKPNNGAIWPILHSKQDNPQSILPTGLALPVGAAHLSYLYLTLALVLIVPTLFLGFDSSHWLIALTTLIAICMTYALVMRAPMYGAAAVLLSLFSTYWAFITVPQSSGLQVILALIILFLGALLSEKHFKDKGKALYFHQQTASPFLLYGITTIMLSLLLANHLEGDTRTTAFLIAALATTGLATLLHHHALGWCATLLFICGLFAWIANIEGDLTAWQKVLGLALPAATLFCDHYFRKLLAKTRPGFNVILLLCAWFGFSCFILETMPDNAWGLTGFLFISALFMGYSGFTKARTAGILAFLTLSATTCILFSWAYVDPISNTPLITNFLFACVLWGIAERSVSSRTQEDPKTPRLRLLHNSAKTLCILVSFLLVILMERIPLLSSFYLTISWTLTAVALMALALALKQKYYRYSALAIFMLALARAFLVDTQALEPAFRIAGVLVLGSVLLAVAYGYIIARNRGTALDEGTEKGIGSDSETP